MSTPAMDALSTQVDANVATMGAAGAKIAALNTTITSLKAQIAATPPEDTAGLAALHDKLATANTALAAAIAASQ